MRFLLILITIGYNLGCSDNKTEPSEKNNTTLQLATTNVTNLQDHIHTLGIYAFRKDISGAYLFHSTLASLNQENIVALPNNTPNGDSKLLTFSLPVGTYQLYALGNIDRDIHKNWNIGLTTPDNAIIHYNLIEADTICFLGTTSFVSENIEGTPLQITLNRIVGKLVCTLYDVPVEIDSVRLALGNLSSAITLAGTTTGATQSIRKNHLVRKMPGYTKDTIVAELIAPPSLKGGSPMELTFFAQNGETRTKEMPIQMLEPDKYIRIVARVDNKQGALLSFDIRLSLFIIDTWREQTMPDFGLNKPL